MDIHQKISTPLALTLTIVLAIAFIGVVLLFNNIPDAFISTSYASTTPVYLGKGCTTAYYIDKDCDGYGVGKRADGSYSTRGLIGDMVDADDNDASINTPATVLQHYDANSNNQLDNDELKLFLSEHKGYNINHIYYFSPEGTDATGEVNNPDKPFGIASYGEGFWNNWDAFLRKVQPGDAVIFRGGGYGRVLDSGGRSFYIRLTNNGEEGNPLFILGYPGERAVMEYSTGISGDNVNHVVIDGLVLGDTVLPGQGKGVDGHFWNDCIVRNIEVSGHHTGMGAGGSIIWENNVIHDSLVEHGIYLGSNEATYSPGENITVRGNVIYRNGRHGFQYNGRVANMLIENNIIHSNTMGGISLLQGVSYSTIRNNLIFNNDKQGIVFYNYHDSPTILPYDQVHNLIENNIIWIGKTIWEGGQTWCSAHGAIVLNNEYGGRSFDYNTIRNNIFVTYDGPTFWFYQQDYADTTTIENNIIYKLGTNSSILRYASANYGNIADFQSFNPTMFTNNQLADPQFTDTSINYYNNPTSFNFNLLSSSPAINFGTTTGAPTTDLRGYIRDSHPDAGAYEYQGSTPPPPPPVTIYGDVNNDSSVTLSDALLVAQYAVGLTTLNSTQIIKADVSGNNAVTAYDASLILQKILGLISTFPVE